MNKLVVGRGRQNQERAERTGGKNLDGIWREADSKSGKKGKNGRIRQDSIYAKKKRKS